jgi:hypothetical protein
MQRLILASFAALGLLATSQEKAAAWTKFTFGVGMNIGMEGGGNSVLWGAYKSAPGPGAGFDGGFGDPYGGGPALPFPSEVSPLPEKSTPAPTGPGTSKPAGYFPIQQASYPEPAYAPISYPGMAYPAITYPFYPIYPLYYGQ